MRLGVRRWPGHFVVARGVDDDARLAHAAARPCSVSSAPRSIARRWPRQRRRSGSSSSRCVGVFAKMVLLSFAVGLLFAAGVMVASFLPIGRRLRRPLAPRAEKPREEKMGYRWSRVVRRHPWRAAFGATLAARRPGVAVVLDPNGIHRSRGAEDRSDHVVARSTSSRNGFGAGFNGPLAIISTDPAMTTVGRIEDRQHPRKPTRGSTSRREASRVEADPDAALGPADVAMDRVPDDVAARPSDSRSGQPITRWRVGFGTESTPWSAASPPAASTSRPTSSTGCPSSSARS